MVESTPGEFAPAPQVSLADPDAVIAKLRTAGAQRFDPVQLHYMEVLARRARSHEGGSRHLLDVRLAHVLAVFETRFEQARCDARQTIARTVTDHPQVAEELERLYVASDFNGVRRKATSLSTSAPKVLLRALVTQLEKASAGNADALPRANPEVRVELKTIRDSRNTWSKISADKQLTQALRQAPKNAGPINSHMLALRSLALMREISPDYLNRFMSYTETLLCLDQHEKDQLGTAKPSRATKTAKK